MIIVDTNVIMAFLLTRGITHRTIAAHKDVFISPEHCFGEIWEHRDVWNRNNVSDEVLKEILDEVKRLFIYPVPDSVGQPAMAEASGLIDDPDDVPIVALALSVHNEGIWTYDTKHFCTEKLKKRIRVLSTSDVAGMYPAGE
jgi:predicted nucleic acid-binding protein